MGYIFLSLSHDDDWSKTLFQKVSGVKDVSLPVLSD